MTSVSKSAYIELYIQMPTTESMCSKLHLFSVVLLNIVCKLVDEELVSRDQVFGKLIRQTNKQSKTNDTQ